MAGLPPRRHAVLSSFPIAVSLDPTVTEARLDLVDFRLNRISKLDGPVVRITTPHIPLPSADLLEDMAIPSVDRIVATIRARVD